MTCRALGETEELRSLSFELFLGEGLLSAPAEARRVCSLGAAALEFAEFVDAPTLPSFGHTC